MTGKEHHISEETLKELREYGSQLEDTEVTYVMKLKLRQVQLQIANQELANLLSQPKNHETRPSATTLKGQDNFNWKKHGIDEELEKLLSLPRNEARIFVTTLRGQDNSDWRMIGISMATGVPGEQS